MFYFRVNSRQRKTELSNQVLIVNKCEYRQKVYFRRCRSRSEIVKSNKSREKWAGMLLRSVHVHNAPCRHTPRRTISAALHCATFEKALINYQIMAHLSCRRSTISHHRKWLGMGEKNFFFFAIQRWAFSFRVVQHKCFVSFSFFFILFFPHKFRSNAATCHTNFVHSSPLHFYLAI